MIFTKQLFGIDNSRPGIMRTVYGDQERFEKTYFSRFPGYYMSGDGAKRDKDGYIWITGRIDDMLNVSGHLMSTAQVESVLVEHSKVAEAAVVPIPHKVKVRSLSGNSPSASPIYVLCRGRLSTALSP